MKKQYLIDEIKHLIQKSKDRIEQLNEEINIEVSNIHELETQLNNI